MHQVTTMLATSKNVLFPGHNYLLTTSTDDPSLAGTRAMIKVSCHQYRWLAGDDLETRILEVASVMVAWWIVGFYAVVHTFLAAHTKKTFALQVQVNVMYEYKMSSLFASILYICRCV